MLTQREVDVSTVSESSLTTTYLEDKVKYYYEFKLFLKIVFNVIRYLHTQILSRVKATMLRNPNQYD